MGISANKFVDLPSNWNSPSLKTYLADSPSAVVKDGSASQEMSNGRRGKSSLEVSERFKRVTDSTPKTFAKKRVEPWCRETGAGEKETSFDLDARPKEALGGDARQMSPPSKLKVENWLNSNFDDDDEDDVDDDSRCGNECDGLDDDKASSQNVLQELVQSHIRGFEMLVGDVEDEHRKKPAGMSDMKFIRSTKLNEMNCLLKTITLRITWNYIHLELLFYLCTE